jgi:sugar phosphate isomerase/epimerase
MASVPYALQLYTVRDHLEADPAGTLQRVKEIGYDHVELAGFPGGSPAACKQLLEDSGLVPTSSHFGFEEVTTTPESVVETCGVLGVSYAVVGTSHEDKAGYLKAAEGLDKGGAVLHGAGIQLCYHNHAHELEEYDGVTALDLLYQNTAPENLAAEIDTCWIQYGKADIVEWITKCSGRCPLLHIKDMTPNTHPTFAEVGRGIIDWPPIFEAAKAAGAVWYIVEQDTCPGDSLESARISAEFMAKQ